MADNAILFYEYVADVLERRAPHRDAHIALLREMHAAGDCVVAGATGEPVSGAAIVFRTPQAAQDFLARDPYIQAGLVTTHRIEPMTIAVP